MTAAVIFAVMVLFVAAIVASYQIGAYGLHEAQKSARYEHERAERLQRQLIAIRDDTPARGPHGRFTKRP